MLFQNSIGVDIRHDTVSIVYLKTSIRGIQMGGHAVYPLDRNWDFENRISHIGDPLLDFIKEHRIDDPELFLSIPRERVIIRELTLPLALKENLRETLSYELDKYIPIPNQDVYFDYLIVSEEKGENNLKILLVAAKKTDLALYHELSETIGHKLSGVEIASIATIDSLHHYLFDCETNPIAAIFKSNEVGEMCLIRNDRICYSKTIQNEKDINSRILIEINSMKTKFTKDDTQFVLCYWDISDNHDLSNCLNHASEIEAMQLNAPHVEAESSHLIPAHALALRGIEKPSASINLYPETIRKRPSNIPKYLMMALSVIVLLSFISWPGSQLILQRMKLKKLNAQTIQLKDDAERIAQVEMTLRAIDKRIKTINDLQDIHHSALDILTELTRIIPDTAWLKSLTFNGDEVQVNGLAEKASDLLPRIESSTLFSNTKLLSAITRERSGSERFRIGFNLEKTK
ncbi:MAG: pilus assembly protein PilM [Deltaproteobacteria bacterium]|nr:pilus assembly protein PilM [Deltaproteobacteria bacterium]